jgi:membrane protein YqaA with SNARE-associated domain
LCFAAGWLRMNTVLSALFIGAGKAARYAVILFVV